MYYSSKLLIIIYSLLETAANEKEAWASLQLGRLHFSGTEGGEIKKSHARARQHFQNAAQYGNIVGIYNLGILTLNGYNFLLICPYFSQLRSPGILYYCFIVLQEHSGKHHTSQSPFHCI